MCRAFSCLVTRGNKVYWKTGVDCHEEVLKLYCDVDANLRDYKSPPFNTFARVEIRPPKGDYLDRAFASWVYKVDERIRPDFLTEKHEELCREALMEWTKEVYAFNVEGAKNPVHPFKIDPPKITQYHVDLLDTWVSVWKSMKELLWESVHDSVRVSVGESVRVSVGGAVWESVWDVVWASVGKSTRESVAAYFGSLFPIKKWAHVNYENPLFKEGEYPFQSAVDLWKIGLVPSFDRGRWRLHGGKDAGVLWEEKV